MLLVPITTIPGTKNPSKMTNLALRFGRNRQALHRPEPELRHPQRLRQRLQNFQRLVGILRTGRMPTTQETVPLFPATRFLVDPANHFAVQRKQTGIFNAQHHFLRE